MSESAVDRHDWESHWEALEEDVHADPASALPELDRLVARMLAETGYDLTDPVARDGGEREVIADYLAAHEILDAAERDAAELSPGDVAAAVNSYRAVFDRLLAIDAQLGLAEEA